MSSIFKSSLGITFITAIGMILGLFKQIVIAKYFGTTSQYDSFLIAIAIPSILGGIAITLFGSSIIPIFTPIKNDKDLFHEAANSVMFLTLFLAAGIFLFGAIVSKFYLAYYTPFTGEKFKLTVKLAIYAWAITSIEIINYMFIAICHLYRKFFFPAALHLFVPISIIISINFGSAELGVESIAIGWLFAVIICFFSLLPFLRKIGINLTLIFSRPAIRVNKYVKEVFYAKIPIILGGFPFTILPTIDGFWASRLPEGSMSYISYCTQITIAIDSLVKNGVYFVLLPFLSENFSSGEEDIFWNRVSLTLKCLYAVLIPIVVFCSYFRFEIISFLFERGAFSKQSTSYISNLLPFYLLGGLLAMVPVTILNRAYYSRKQYLLFAIIAISMIGFYIISSWVLSYFWGVWGIGATYNIYWFLFLIISTKFLSHSWINFSAFKMIFKILCSLMLSILFIHFAPIGFNQFINLIVGIICFVFFVFLLRVHSDLEINKLLKINIKNIFT